MDVTIVALDQHFCNTSRSSKVSINLEGRMGTKQIRIGSCASALIGRTTSVGRLQQLSQDLKRMIPIMQPCPEQDFPSSRPTCSFISTDCQGFLSCFCPFRTANWRNKISWI